MGSYLGGLLFTFLPSRRSRPSRKTNAPPFLALLNSRQPDHWPRPLGLVGLRFRFGSRNTPIDVTTGIPVPVEHKKRLMNE